MLSLTFCFIVFGAIAPPHLPQWARASSFTRFLAHKQGIVLEEALDLSFRQITDDDDDKDIHIRATCFDLIGHPQALPEHRFKRCSVFLYCGIPLTL